MPAGPGLRCRRGRASVAGTPMTISTPKPSAHIASGCTYDSIRPPTAGPMVLHVPGRPGRGGNARRAGRDQGQHGSMTSISAAGAAHARFRTAAAVSVILADGANMIIYLSPSPVVAKVPASTTAVRPDSAAWLQRELDVASFLARAGAPVMAPSPEVPVCVHRADGQVMSFWRYLEPAGTALPDEAVIGM